MIYGENFGMCLRMYNENFPKGVCANFRYGAKGIWRKFS